MKFVNLDLFMGNDYNNWIFDKLSDFPITEDASTLNLLYSAHSGEKWISPICFKLNGSEDVATDDTKTTLAKLVQAKYMENWQRLYSAMFADYNPIENYSLKEHETLGVKSTDTGSTTDNATTTDKGTTERTNHDTTTHENTDTINNTKDTTNTSKQTNTQENLQQVYAEDSEEAVNASKQVGSGESDVNGSTKETGNTTNNGSGSQISDGNDTTTIDDTKTTTASGSHTSNGTEDSERNKTRSGNIGVTTSQQMIESEIALRKHNYYDIIFKDIDDMLCLHIY